MSLVVGLGVVLAAPLQAVAEFSLPPLPYAANGLEPSIDARTMTIHHDRHHAAYVANLNAQIPTFPELASVDLTTLQGSLATYSPAVRNHGGGRLRVHVPRALAYLILLHTLGVCAHLV